MRNSLAHGLLCVAFGLALARAQTTTPVPEATHAPEPTGSVSGRVYFADTNQPARFATVSLQQAPQKSEAPRERRVNQDPPSTPPTIRTGLDGSFFFPKVKPGTYFLIADYAGYVSPLAKLSSKELASKAPADIEKVEKALVRVTVAPNKDSSENIDLERGAAVSGTIRYDDGSPANEVQVAVLRVGEDGISPVSLNLTGQMRTAFHALGEGDQTNDLGHYRISGLPAGKYVLRASLPTTISSFGGLFGGQTVGSFRTDDSVALSVYTGNVFREKDAKSFEVTGGSERDDVDITIPLLGLHSVSGSITALSDGHPIQEGSASLLFADDKSELRSFGWFSSDPGSFNLRFVPEGEYILRVTDAADVTEEQVTDSEIGGKLVAFRQVHAYASIDLPISIHSNLSNVNISLPDKPADKPSATAQKQ